LRLRLSLHRFGAAVVGIAVDIRADFLCFVPRGRVTCRLLGSLHGHSDRIAN
jgi:hypothetical protein